MRLWHEALIPHLPRQQLLGLHREVCALRGLGWGKKHATVNYVFGHPYGWLVAYHYCVMQEMEKRGFKPDKLWWFPGYRGKSCGSEIYALGFSFSWSTCERMYECEKMKCPVFPEHDAAYLRECLENLAGKGIYINMEEKKK